MTSSVFSQKKNSLTISTIAAIYNGVEDEDYSGRHLGYYRYPSPGLELSYKKEIFNGFYIGTGINYQLGFVSSYINNYERRFTFNDICFPLLFTKYFKVKDKEHFFLTSGIYLGKTIKIKAQYPTSPRWIEWPDYKTIENYSDDIRYSDFYVDFGYHTLLKKHFIFSFAPFFKYRINTTWLNYHQNKFQFGINVNYSLNF
jgi:hypothetical protein